MDQVIGQRKGRRQISVTIDDMVAEVRREMTHREMKYAQLVERGYMSEEKALQKMAAMSAVGKVLIAIRDRRNEIPADILRLRTEEVEL